MQKFDQMRVLVIGASGLVGGNTLKVFKDQGIEANGTYFSYPTNGLEFFNTLDPNDERNFDIDQFAPTHIIHTGALTHVDQCETRPDDSYRQTVASTINITELAKKRGISVTYISTDYVFDGDEGPYDECAPTNPLSVYGKHKLEAENIITHASRNHLIVRVTGVYGTEERNKNFVSRMILAAKSKEEIEMRLPVDQYSTPVNAEDIGRGIATLLKKSSTGIYHLGGTDYLNRVQLATKVLGYFPEHRVELIPTTTAVLQQAAPRPLQGGLKSGKFMSEFPLFRFSGVDEFTRKSL